MTKRLDSLPPEITGALLDRALNDPRQNSAAFTLALDRILDKSEWATREKELCMKLHNMFLRGANVDETWMDSPLGGRNKRSDARSFSAGLTLGPGWASLRSMKRILQWIALAALVFSMTSCGLPGAAVRSASRLVQSAGSLVAPAAAAL